MTTPHAVFAAARQRAATIADNNLCTYDDMGPLDALHTEIFTALGGTTDQIAATLAGHGVTGSLPEVVVDGDEVYGDLVDDEGCALAVFFRDVCGAASAVFGTSGGQVYWDGTHDEVGHEDVELPDALAAFQRGYENFAYPALYRSPVPAGVSR